MNWYVAYDISDDRRRDRMATLLSGLGWRIQFSVFEIEASQRDVDELVEDIEATIDDLVDRVHLLPAWKNGPDRIMLGQATLPSEDRFYIV